MATIVTLPDGRTGYRRADGTFSESHGAHPAVSRGDAKPYESENTASVIHGGWSDRLVSEEASEVLAELIEIHGAAWLMALDGVVVNVLVRAKVRHDRFDRRIDEFDDVCDIPKSVLEQVSREARQVVDCCAKLGLTATDRAALMKDTGWAKVLGGGPQLGEQGRAIREARKRV